MTARSFRPPANGFSLVELMVVLFIMGLLAATVVLALPPGEASLRRDAERFAARTAAARDQAVIGARPVALVVGSAGYYFEARAGGGWQPLDQAGLVPWGEGVSASIGAAARGDSQRERLVFDPVGLASGDAAVRLSRGGRAMTVRIARDGTVRLDAG
ncbi:MAG: GspH/FimT family pseudopilin [Novosphingobium sp.]